VSIYEFWLAKVLILGVSTKKVLFLYRFIMSLKHLYTLLFSVILIACTEKKERVATPWGTTLGEDTVAATTNFALQDIISGGELIMLTLSGPESYYDYHGRGMGTQYLLCEKFAKNLGVSLRVEVCRDTTEMVKRLEKGDGDLIAYFLPKEIKGLTYCGASIENPKRQWAVLAANTSLADTLNRWYQPKMLAQIQQEERFVLSARSIKRHVYSPMLNRSSGVISHYDHLFQKYAATARWDWRLLAAQCYQESTFDPNAKSWAGACGLMQIMPSTAVHLGLPAHQMFEPEPNIAAATRFIRELDSKLSDIGDRTERICFILGSYNGGLSHIRDAMALARKHGQNPHRWAEVSPFVLRLSNAQYYKDPVVKYGYMRGNETVDYVDRIRNRWAQYSGMVSGGFSGGSGSMVPQKATKKYRFHI
jgi:transglycosylase, SLT family